MSSQNERKVWSNETRQAKPPRARPNSRLADFLLGGATRTMKSIASFFPRRERKPHPAFERMVTPSQTLVASVVLFCVALWPLLTVRFGRPMSWFGDFLFLLCATVSVFAPAALCVATFIDIIRRRADARLIAAFVISLAGVVAIVAFIYLRIRSTV